ncbi:TonB-dependent receptor [Aquidulcibacter sp.]|uniref:TonB-dependent receptor n=1 Tax=Aquidulcibacter sp. TaxID=2052990 RepID=UPI0025BDA6BE|nr:TonB-dependent receptor [Aquidulcibacter sp.]MCA3696896.1 TonB-dependent receptor [Aquidulcibacter sp.]
MTPALYALLALTAPEAAPPAVPAGQARPVETIVVTASSLGDPSDAISQGVAVINRGEALQASISGGIGETLAGIPSVRSTFYGVNASRPIVRGLGEDRIRLVLNGLQGIDASTISPDHAPAIDGLDAEGIEVLKGPAALRYGGNAVGGVVNVVDGRLPTKLPEKPFAGEIFLAGSTAEDAGTAAFKLVGTKGAGVFRVDGFRREGQDYKIPGFSQTAALRAITGDDTEGTAFNTRGEIWALGGSVAHITDRTSLALSTRRTKSNYGIPGEEAFIELSQTRYDFQASIKDLGVLDALTFSITSGDYTHSEIEFDGAIGTVFTNEGYEGRLEARHRSIGALDGVFGLQFAANDFAAKGDEAFILPVTIETVGAFWVERFNQDNWGAEVGARYEQRDYSGLAGSRNFDLGSFSASAFLKPSEGLRLSLNAGYTERAPTEVELFADGPHAATQAYEIGDVDLKTETATSLEGVARWQVGGATVDLNIWRTSFDGFIAFNPTNLIEDDLPVFLVSQKDATLTGAELHVTWALGEFGGWSVVGDGGVDTVRGTYDGGGAIARMPPAMVTLGLEAKSPQMRVRAEVQSIAEQGRTATFETKTEGSTAINALWSWRPVESNDRIELTFEGRNLTNEDIREHTSFLKDYLPKPGRSIRVSLKGSF